MYKRIPGAQKYQEKSEQPANPVNGRNFPVYNYDAAFNLKVPCRLK